MVLMGDIKAANGDNCEGTYKVIMGYLKGTYKAAVEIVTELHIISHYILTPISIM